VGCGGGGRVWGGGAKGEWGGGGGGGGDVGPLFTALASLHLSLKMVHSDATRGCGGEC